MNAISADKMEQDRMIHLGNQLFRFRHWFYLIPIVLIALTAKKVGYPFQSHFYDEVFEFTGLGVALLGVVVRIWASGSSRRSFTQKDKHLLVRFDTKGVFSLVRNPFFVGDFLIILGLSIPLFNFALVGLSIGIFLLMYLPILLAKEKLLSVKFPQSYSAYKKKVPAAIPLPGRWIKSTVHFRWMVAFQKVGSVLVIVGLLFFLIEELRDFEIIGAFDDNPLWVLTAAVFLFVFLILKSFGEDMSELPLESPEFPD